MADYSQELVRRVLVAINQAVIQARKDGVDCYHPFYVTIDGKDYIFADHLLEGVEVYE